MITELLVHIFSYIEPWLTREDWRTCKQKEAQIIRRTAEALALSRPRNSFVPTPYKTWSFYERLRFGKDYYLKSPYFSKAWTDLFRKRKCMYP